MPQAGANASLQSGANAAHATGNRFSSGSVVSGGGANGTASGSGSNTVNALMLSRLSASRNDVGVPAAAANASATTLTDKVVSNNSYGVGGSAAAVMGSNSSVSNNVGIAADQAATVQVGQSTLTANGTGSTATNAGNIVGYGNKNVSSNGAALALPLPAAPANAETMRRYVSVNGRDENPCTATSPCQTFQGAIAKTMAGGEIYALNSGNFGPVTITQSVNLTGANVAAGVMAAGVSGVTINAGPNDVVQLRGLDVNGGGTGTTGIQFNSGSSLQIKDSTIRGFVTGLGFTPSASGALFVQSTLINNNTTGVFLQGAMPNSGVLSDVQVIGNVSGLVATGSNNAAIATLTVQGSVVASNRTVGLLSNGNSVIAVTDSTISNNGIGLQAQNGGALIPTSGSTITANGTGMVVANGGQIVSGNMNAIGGNTSGNSLGATSTAGGQSELIRPTSPTENPTSIPTSNYLVDQAGGYILDENGAKIAAM